MAKCCDREGPFLGITKLHLKLEHSGDFVVEEEFNKFVPKVFSYAIITRYNLLKVSITGTIKP